MQVLQLKARGLYTNPSDLSSVPDGALSVADDVVIDKEDLVEPRRGFNRSYATLLASARKLFMYQNYMFALDSGNLLKYYSTILATTSANFTGSGAWTSVGSYTPPTGTRMRTVEASQNLYFTTTSGIYKMDAYNSTPKIAGAYKALDVTATIISVTGNWLANNSYVAYRVVWGYKDANNNLILGAPSSREVIQNVAGGTRSVTLSINVPSGVTTAWFYQVYRTAAVASADPGDAMGLVYEANYVSGSTVTVSDITPDSLRGADLYTNATQEGLANGNEQPPLAKDIAVYKDCLFLGNTTGRYRYTVSLLSTNGTNALVADNTVTIGGVTYTAKSPETIASAQFKVFSTASVAVDIRDTALSLIRVVNQHASSTVYAYYLSGPDDLPGQILFEARTLGAAAFTVASNNTTAWAPVITTAQSATNDAFLNGLSFSKSSQPEAVPLGNYFFCGNARKAILRIVPLRDSLFIFKEDGIYRLSGEDPNSFRVDLFDSTVRLLAAESVVVLNNQIFALTDQGVVSVTESGVAVRSRSIESTLLNLQGVNLSVLQTESFGVAYESERKYLLWVPSTSGDTSPSQAFVFNAFTNAWTRWVLAQSCGIVNPADNKLYLGDVDDFYVSQERKTYTYQDYADYGLTATISAVSTTTVTIDNTDSITAGDVIYQSSTLFGIVDSVDAIAGTVTMLYATAFANGTVTVYKAIPAKVAWIPITGGNPGTIKQFREVSLLFKSTFTSDGALYFSSDISPSQEIETITGAGFGSWGIAPWGTTLWGGDTGRVPTRVYVALNKQRCTQLTIEFRHAVAFSSWQLNGVAVSGNFGSERVAV